MVYVCAARFSLRVLLLSVIMPDAGKIKRCLLPTQPYLNSPTCEPEIYYQEQNLSHAYAVPISIFVLIMLPDKNLALSLFPSWHVIT